VSKVKYEFQCTNCQKYFDVKLNISLNGNYRIHCPNCQHIHYRKVEEGKITDTRFTENDDKILIEDIWPMKASCRDFQKDTYKDLDQNSPEAGAGFMHRLWTEKFSAHV